MFYYIEGKAALVEQGLCVVDCAGVGYACHTSQHTLSRVKQGEVIRLYTYLYVREDIFDLYGFIDQEEMNCFKLLIGVSGVGPKAALAILSIAPPSQLALSIITGDEKLLTQASGIGKKIAQRIVLELRDKLSKEQMQTAKGGASVMEMPSGAGVNHTQEAIAALMVLGYAQSEALQALEGLNLAEYADTEAIIRACLKRIAMG
ncbi:MAG: Holliday junction branch migration protein RuvA [Butyricicoccus pullicaecorum]|nr:Holliday junction branch migration protein RuvA [Butyricicoccus pullicaecorum]